MKREGRDSLLLRRMGTQLGLIKNATVCWDIRHSILNNRNRGPDVKPVKSCRTFEKCTQILTMKGVNIVRSLGISCRIQVDSFVFLALWLVNNAHGCLGLS